MLEYGGAARQYFGQVASNVLRFAALAHQVHEIGVPIEVVIILQQGEFIDLLERRIGLVPRQPTGQVDRHLFVSNSVRNNAFIAGDQPIDGLLLLLFYAPDQSQGLLQSHVNGVARHLVGIHRRRSEEHTSELQSIMRISYAVFCLKKKKYTTTTE